VHNATLAQPTSVAFGPHVQLERMDDDQLATGLGTALLIDTLLGLGIDDPLALTHDEQVRVIEEAAADGQIDEQRLGALRDVGAVPHRDT
jgi:hypothetical protein